MKPSRISPLLSTLLALAVLPAHAASLQQAAQALSGEQAKTLSFSASGRWFQFGQAPAPGLPWPQFDVSSYEAAFDFEQGAAHVQQTRKQTIDPNRARPTPTEQKPDQYLLADKAWNLAPPANTAAAAGTPAVATAQPGQVAERQAELLATPQGFIRAALANQAKVKPGKDGASVSFTLDGKYRYVGQLDHHNHLTRVQTWIDNPVLGDTLVETRYSDYREFGGVTFPAHIVRVQGGHPVLDLQVTDVKLNLPLAIALPPEVVASANAAPAITVATTTLAPGVIHLTGGSHNSVAIEQKDHVVVVEAPLNEERSLAVIAKVKELFPGKPIKFLINSHAHFDHAGGLRTWVAEGTTIVTAKANRDYYQKVWAAPHTINPDQLAQHKKAAKFDTFTGKHVLTDGQRTIEIYPISGNTHNDAFALVYLPAEKILIEADAYNPTAAPAAPNGTPNPYSVNLYENIRKLKLDVQTIAGLHGAKAVPLADLRAAIGASAVQL
jgi:glyoxylase-like metal-dependent hydrolase (beta-lactamase superfamily II)